MNFWHLSTLEKKAKPLATRLENNLRGKSENPDSCAKMQASLWVDREGCITSHPWAGESHLQRPRNYNQPKKRRASHSPAWPGRRRCPTAAAPFAPRCSPAAPPCTRRGPGAGEAAGWGTGVAGPGACPSSRRSRTWRARLRRGPSHPAFSTSSWYLWGSGYRGLPPRSSGPGGLSIGGASPRDSVVLLESGLQLGCVSDSLPDRCHLDSLHRRPLSCWKKGEE